MVTLLAPFTASARVRCCGHGVEASRVGLVDAEGEQIIRTLRITNLDVIEFTAQQRAAGDVLAFVAADGCAFTEPLDQERGSDPCRT
jgi:hypothetical protein